MKEIIEIGRRVLSEESKALVDLIPYIDEKFVSAVNMISSTYGLVIVTGMGKSGHIGRKISATLTSVGVRSVYIHPGEAEHGDIGIIGSEDICILLSHSGETNELIRIIPTLRKSGAKIISITSNCKSRIAQAADIYLNTYVEKDDCLLGVIPTTSTTVTLALGDAIAIAVSKKRGLCKDDFARFHPGGIIGKSLLLRVEDIMLNKNELVIALEMEKISEVLFDMTNKKIGFAVIVDKDEQVLGIVTDGDIRRTVISNFELLGGTCGSIMTRNPILVSKDDLLSDSLLIMKEKNISCLIVSENNKVVGGLDTKVISKEGIR